MALTVSNAENFQVAFQAFTQINFNAFDYNSVKESLLNYVKLYFPEDFNDYIESSEFIAILELFAYMAELLAYRIDLNANENFITTAQRKESILRLAKFISYTPSRNIPCRGLVKLTSVQTTQNLIDSTGVNLAGVKVIWNDNNNVNWQEQFILIMNQVLTQTFGSVAPQERVQVEDVLFELYTLDNNPLNANGNTTFSYSATVTGQSYPLELVPSQLTSTGPVEARPQQNSTFTILFANDGLGDASNMTGFLMFTKQGQLQSQTTSFDGITPNQVFNISVNNINETDVWVNNINPTTGQILTVNPNQTIVQNFPSGSLLFGEWVEVDTASGQNILFNTNPNQHKYEIESLNNDQINVIFGDGQFAAIPSGTFQIFYRTSAGIQLSIPMSSVVNQTASFTYADEIGNTQTLTFQFSLTSSLLNSSPSETLQHIQQVAPGVYYSQDRMVNGQDYNSFPLQDPSILKLQATDRTFAGDSQYIPWFDPSDTYQNVKIFGDDLALYWIATDPLHFGIQNITSPISATELVVTYVEPLLCSTDIFGYLAYFFAQPDFTGTPIIRCQFNTTPDAYYYGFINSNELTAITNAIATSIGSPIQLWYSPVYNEWTVGENPEDVSPGQPWATKGLAQSVFLIQVTPVFNGSTLTGWTVQWGSRRMVAQSATTQFWNINTSGQEIDLDTLNTVKDYIAVLSANVPANQTTSNVAVGENINFPIIAQELVYVDTLPNAGLPDINRVDVVTEDADGDGFPDNVTVPQLFNNTQLIPVSSFGPLTSVPINIPLLQTIVFGQGDPDLKVYVINGSGQVTKLQYGATFQWVDAPMLTNQLLSQQIQINNPVVTLAGAVTLRIDYIDNAYLATTSNQEPYEPVPTSDIAKTNYAANLGSAFPLYIRYPGRYPFNFAWYHFAETLNLIDPSRSNIIDMFIITTGFHNDMVNFLAGLTNVAPTPETPASLTNTYGYLLNNAMISDTVILHPGVLKVLFGSNAIPQLQATFSVIRPATGTTLTDNEVKVRIITDVQNYFNTANFNFGQTFFFSDLAASIHSDLGPEISSVVLVPTYPTNFFGTLYQITAGENEIFIPDVTTANIEIVTSYTPQNINQCGS